MTKPIFDALVIASLQGSWDGYVDTNFGRIKDLIEGTPWPIMSQPTEASLAALVPFADECLAVGGITGAPAGLPIRIFFCNTVQFLPLTEAYNETEQLTGSTWIDGRPIWRKTIAVDVPASSGTETTAHGIGVSLDLTAIVSLHAVVTDGSRTLPVPSQFGSSATMSIEIDATNIKIIGYGAGLSGFAGIATVDFCKV